MESHESQSHPRHNHNELVPGSQSQVLIEHLGESEHRLKPLERGGASREARTRDVHHSVKICVVHGCTNGRSHAGSRALEIASSRLTTRIQQTIYHLM